MPVKEGIFTKMVEVLPKEGLVKVSFTFKEDQLANLKVMEKADVSAMYLPLNEKIRKEHDSTMQVKDPAVSDIEPEEITCKVLLYGLDDVEKDEVSFVAPGASVFAIRSDKAEVPVVEAAEAAEEVPAEEVAEEVPVEETAEVIEETEVQAEETAELAPAGAEAKTAEEAEPTESAQPVGEPLEHKEQAETDEVVAKMPNGLEAAFSKKKLAETPVTRTGRGTDGRAFVELAVMKVLVDGAVDNENSKDVVPSYNPKYKITVNVKDDATIIVLLDDQQYREYKVDYKNNSVSLENSYPYTPKETEAPETQAPAVEEDTSSQADDGSAAG